MMRAPGLALFAALLTSSCGAALMKLPQGSGSATADGRNALAEATSACHAVSSISAEIGVSGSLNGQRVRARLNVGLATPDAARVEALALGQPLFVFVSRAKDATLVLQRDNRVLEHGPPDAILEAVTGVPVGPDTLRTLLTGCTIAADSQEARALGDDWRVVPDGSDLVFLQRSPHQAPWQVVAVTHRDSTGAEWRAEYRKIVKGLPNDVRLRSQDGRRFDLHLTLSQVLVNDTFDDRVFRVQVPASADRITLEELRTSGPLSGTSGTSGASGQVR